MFHTISPRISVSFHECVSDEMIERRLTQVTYAEWQLLGECTNYILRVVDTK